MEESRMASEIWVDNTWLSIEEVTEDPEVVGRRSTAVFEGTSMTTASDFFDGGFGASSDCAVGAAMGSKPGLTIRLRWAMGDTGLGAMTTGCSTCACCSFGFSAVVTLLLPLLLVVSCSG